MLRVHCSSFTRRNAKKSSVKEIDAIEKSAVLRIHRSRRIRVGAEIHAPVPALTRNLSNGILALRQQFPKGGRIGHAAGKAQPGADDRNRFTIPSVIGGSRLRRFQLFHPGAKRANFLERPLDRRQLRCCMGRIRHGLSLFPIDPVPQSGAAPHLLRVRLSRAASELEFVATDSASNPSR